MISLLIFALPALVAAAPANPASFCDRFIKEADQSVCQRLAASANLDWYAAGLCGLMEEDENLLPCWKAVEGRAFYPPRLSECEKDELSDGERQSCLVRVSSAANSAKDRAPANATGPIYQPLLKQKQLKSRSKTAPF